MVPHYTPQLEITEPDHTIGSVLSFDISYALSCGMESLWGARTARMLLMNALKLLPL